MTGEQGLEQALAEWIATQPSGVKPRNEGLLVFFESACGLVIVPLLLDITARYTDWVHKRTLEFTGGYGILLMMMMWLFLSRDFGNLHEYGARGLAIAYTTTLLHQKTKPAQWEPEPGEETTMIHDIRRHLRGTGDGT